MPTYETIASYEYPGARPLYIYVKGAHLNAIPGLKQFVAEYAQRVGPGRLPQAPRPDRRARRRARARTATIATKLTPFDPAQAE